MGQAGFGRDRPVDDVLQDRSRDCPARLLERWPRLTQIAAELREDRIEIANVQIVSDRELQRVVVARCE